MVRILLTVRIVILARCQGLLPVGRMRIVRRSIHPWISLMPSQIHSESNVPLALVEGQKIWSFCSGLDADEQLSSSYRLPIEDMSADILADIYEHISSTTSGMLSKKVSKLLPLSGVRSRCYYHFEGEEVANSHFLPRHMTELAGIRSYENLNKADVVLSSSEAEDLEAAACTVIEATLWMDWWTFVAESMTLQGSDDSKMLKRLFVTGTRWQLLVAKTTSTLWANLILKHRDTVLAKVKNNISFESFMDFRNSPLFGSTELFSKDAVERAMKNRPGTSMMKLSGRLFPLITLPRSRPNSYSFHSLPINSRLLSILLSSPLEHRWGVARLRSCFWLEGFLLLLLV